MARRNTVRASSGQGLGPGPVTTGHRDQRSLAQRMREHIGRAHVPDADRVPRGRRRRHRGHRRGPARNLARARPPAPRCSPPRTCARLRRRRRASAPPRRDTTRPAAERPTPRRGDGSRSGADSGRRAVLPAIDRVGPPLGLGRPPDRHRRQTRPTGRPSDAPRSRPAHPATETTAEGCRPGLAGRSPETGFPPAEQPDRRPRRRWSTPAMPRPGRCAGTMRRHGAAGPGSGPAPRVPAPRAACRGTGGGSDTTVRVDPAAPAAGSTAPDPPTSRPSPTSSSTASHSGPHIRSSTAVLVKNTR